MTDATYDRDFGAKVQRDVMPTRGASFDYDYDERVAIFTFVIDTGNIIGPRPATKADSEKHPEAFAKFARAYSDAPRWLTELRDFFAKCGVPVVDELDRFDADMTVRLEAETDAFARQIVPDGREMEPPAEPETIVEEKDMSAFVERIEPAPEAPAKRKYTRKAAA